MTLTEAREFSDRLDSKHPEGCSCGSTECLSIEESSTPDQSRESLLASIIRDQTDWQSQAAKREFCRANGVPCI